MKNHIIQSLQRTTQREPGSKIDCAKPNNRGRNPIIEGGDVNVSWNKLNDNIKEAANEDLGTRTKALQKTQ